MANFEATATAAVTKLQETDGKLDETEARFTGAGEHLQQTSEEFQSVASTILTSLDALTARIRAARSEQSGKREQLAQQLVEIKQESAAAQQRNSSEVSELKQGATQLHERIETAQQQIGDQAESAVGSLQQSTEAAAAAKTKLQTALEQLQAKLARADTDLQQQATAVDEKQAALVSRLTSEVTPKLTEQGITARENLDELQSQLGVSLTEVHVELEQSSTTLVEQVSTEQANTLDALTTHVSGFAENVNTVSQQTAAQGESMIVMKDTMNTAMDSTAIGMRALLGILQDMREIMERVA